MPDAPVQIIPNGTGSTPAAPPTVAAAAGGATPAAPVQIAANGSGSTPASPVQIAANGSSSTPGAPPQVLLAAAAGGGSLTYATASLTVTGSGGGDGVVSILGYTFGLEVTTPASGLSLAETYAANLAAEINSFFDGFGFRPIASRSGAVVTLEANLPGMAGNQIDVSSTDPSVIASGPYLSGGGGDPIITVSGALTKDGSAAVTIPTLSWDQSRVSAQREYSSNGWDYDTGGPPLTGWHYTAQIQGVMTGTFPTLVLSGYKWRIAATRYTAGVFAEVARWGSTLQPSSHPIEAATGWTPESPATGTPAVTVPVLQGFAAPPVVIAAASGSTPASPVQIASNGAASTPAAPGQIAPNGSAATPAAPPAIV